MSIFQFSRSSHLNNAVQIKYHIFIREFEIITYKTPHDAEFPTTNPSNSPIVLYIDSKHNYL